MKNETLQARALVLRDSVQLSQRRLDEAVATLGRVSTEELSIGGRMSRDPWGWILGACLIGGVIALSRGADERIGI